VVVQRRLVDELDGDPSEQDLLGDGGIPGGGRGHGQRGSEPLAPRGDKVGRDLAEEGVFGGHDPAEGHLETGQIVLEPGKAEHLSDVHWWRNLGEMPASTTTRRGSSPPIRGRAVGWWSRGGEERGTGHPRIE